MLPLDSPGELQSEQPVHQKGLQSLDLETVGDTTSDLATPTASARQPATQTCQGHPSSPVRTLSMESGPLKPSCLETGYSKWTGEKSLLRGIPRGNKTGKA